MLENKSAQVEIINDNNRPLYLYTHSGAKTLVNTVYEVLSMRKRWDDADYLSRMIFCAMIPKEKWYDEYGYGIGTSIYDVDLLISINIPKQKIKLQITNDLHNYEQMSIEDFVNDFYNSASL